MSRRSKGSIPTAVSDELREIEELYADDETYGSELSQGELNALEDHFQALAKQLTSLSLAELERLKLDSELQKTVEIYINAGNGPAKRRTMQRIRTLIRAVGYQELEAALNGDGPGDENTALLEFTRKKLVAGDDDYLHNFAVQHPKLDRQRLRQLLRGARGEGDKAKKAYKAIYVLLKEVMV